MKLRWPSQLRTLRVPHMLHRVADEQSCRHLCLLLQLNSDLERGVVVLEAGTPLVTRVVSSLQRRTNIAAVDHALKPENSSVCLLIDPSSLSPPHSLLLLHSVPSAPCSSLFLMQCEWLAD